MKRGEPSEWGGDDNHLQDLDDTQSVMSQPGGGSGLPGGPASEAVMLAKERGKTVLRREYFRASAAGQESKADAAALELQIPDEELRVSCGVLPLLW